MEYTITAISNFGGWGSDAWGINEEGTVIGDAGGQGYGHAMRFKNNGVTDLTPGQNITASEAHGVNNLPQEQIVGEYRAGGNTKSFLWSNGVFTDLHQVVGGNYSVARDINDSGQIVGTKGSSSGSGAQAFIYDLNTNAVTTPLPSNSLNFGTAINVHGHIVGRMSNPTHGYLYNGTVDFLPTLGGNATYPTDINDIGLIVGSSMIASGDSHAFVHDEHGIHDIHLGANYSKARAINNQNVIVGEVNLGNGTRAFIREPGKDMVELSSQISHLGGWSELRRATGINDDGQICGSGIFNDEYRGFLLTPINEGIFDRVESDLPILVATILFGVGRGGGGVLVVGGKIIPIDPPVPYKDLIARNRRELGHLIANQLSVPKKGETRNIERLIKEVYDQGVKNHRKFHQGPKK